MFKNNRRIIMYIIKALIVVLLISYILFLIRLNEVADKPLKEAVGSSIDILDKDTAKEKDYQELKKNYGLNGDDLEGYIYYGPISMMDVTEFLAIKVADKEQLQDIELAIKNRLKEQKKNFDGYGTDQMDLLEHSVLKIKGDYILFVVAENADEITSLFLKNIKN